VSALADPFLSAEERRADVLANAQLVIELEEQARQRPRPLTVLVTASSGRWCSRPRWKCARHYYEARVSRSTVSTPSGRAASEGARRERRRARPVGFANSSVAFGGVALVRFGAVAVVEGGQFALVVRVSRIGNTAQAGRASERLSDASSARSARVSFGCEVWRRRIASSCRRTRISSSFERCGRASSHTSANRFRTTLELADDPFVSPARVLLGATNDQLAERALQRRPPGLPVRVSPAAGNELAVPSKQCVRPAPAAAAKAPSGGGNFDGAPDASCRIALALSFDTRRTLVGEQHLACPWQGCASHASSDPPIRPRGPTRANAAYDARARPVDEREITQERPLPPQGALAARARSVAAWRAKSRRWLPRRR
jgi:hypothetical protein